MPSLHPTSQRTPHIKGSSQQTAPSHYFTHIKHGQNKKGVFKTLSYIVSFFCTSCTSITFRPSSASSLPSRRGSSSCTTSSLRSVARTSHPCIGMVPTITNIIFKKLDHKHCINVILDMLDFIFHMLDHIILDGFDQHCFFSQVISYT